MVLKLDTRTIGAIRRPKLRSNLLSTAAALFIVTPVCTAAVVAMYGCGQAYAAGGAGGAGGYSNGGAGGAIGTAGNGAYGSYGGGSAGGAAGTTGVNSGAGYDGQASSAGNGGGGGGANGVLGASTGGSGGNGGSFAANYEITDSIGGGGGGAGGNGVTVSTGYTASGYARGGNGGAGGYGHVGNYTGNPGNGGGGGDGGNGIVATAPGLTIITPAGTGAYGGNGGNGGNASGGAQSGIGGSGGNGGIGITGPGQTTVINGGYVYGGNGGNVGQGSASGPTNGIGGAGVSLGAGSSLTNTGYIGGGSGGGQQFLANGTATTAGGVGGDGAVLGDNSNVSNSGLIRGGNGGAGSSGYVFRGEAAYQQFNGGAGGTGGAGVRLGNSSTLINSATGVIRAGDGGKGGFSGYGGGYKSGAAGVGGFGVIAGTSSSVTNVGLITGGYGGGGGPNFTPGSVSGTGGAGGAGVYVGANSTVTNSGTITGGGGGYGGLAIGGAESGSAGAGGVGGAGVVLGAGSTLTNSVSGVISGGLGGYGGTSLLGGIYGDGGSGGAGVIAAAGGTINNAGQILGGNGLVNTNGGLSGNGGAGIIAANATITNATGGLIQGGSITTITEGKGGGGIADAVSFAALPAAAVSPSGASNGVGGVGIIGSDLTISNAGTIAGGLAGDGVSRSYGIVFTGGTNYVGGPGTINGGINVTGTSIFQPALPTAPVGTVLQNVNGPLRFDPTATYQVRITPTVADRAIITGAAALNGASVNVVAGAGTYRTMTYTILTATGGVAGTFSNLSTTSNLAFLKPTLSYDPNDVFLSLTFTAPIVTPSGKTVPNYGVAALTLNQKAVAAGLTNAAIFSGDNGRIFTALNQLTVSQARAAFDALSGEGYSGAQNLGLKAGELFTSSIFDQTTLYGTGQTGNSIVLCEQLPGSLLFNPNGNQCAPAPVRELADLPSRAAQPVPPFVPMRTWRAWATGYGGVDDIHGNVSPIGSASQNNSLYGGVLGIDYQVNPNLLVGVAAGGSDGNFQVASRGTYGSTTGGQVGLYGLATAGNFYGAASVSFADYSNQGTRNVAGFGGLGSEIEKGSFGSYEFRTRLEAGRHFAGLGGILTPFVAMEIAEFHSNGFTETSASGAGLFRLNEAGQQQLSLPTFVGARLQRPTALGGGMVLTPTLQLAYVHEFSPYRQEQGTLVSLPGSTFLVDGARPGRDSGQVKAGAELKLNPSSAIFANFEGDFSGVEQFYGGKGGFRFVW